MHNLTMDFTKESSELHFDQHYKNLVEQELASINRNGNKM